MANTEEKKDYGMKYDVRIYPATADGPVRANASVTINDCFAVHNIRLVDGTNGMFVSMPGVKLADKSYKDICFPCTKEAKIEFDRAVISAYDKMMTPKQASAHSQKQAGMSNVQ